MMHTNKKTLEWIDQQSAWKPVEDVYTVVLIKKHNNKPESLITANLKDAFEYMNKNKNEVLYFIKMFKEV